MGKVAVADAWKPSWRGLQCTHAKLRAVPSAVLVFDCFNILKLFNDRLSAQCQDLHRETTEEPHPDNASRNGRVALPRDSALYPCAVIRLLRSYGPIDTEFVKLIYYPLHESRFESAGGLIN